MADAYKTSVELKLINQVSPGLRNIIREVERATGLVKDLNKAFGTLHFGKGALEGIGAVNREIEGLKGVIA